jgi:hypothetical protein
MLKLSIKFISNGTGKIETSIAIRFISNILVKLKNYSTKFRSVVGKIARFGKFWSVYRLVRLGQGGMRVGF